MVCSLVTYETDEKGTRKPDLTTVIPVVDGGTEAFSGHVRAFTPWSVPTLRGCAGHDPPPPNSAITPMSTKQKTRRHSAPHFSRLRAWITILIWTGSHNLAVCIGLL